VFSWHAFSIICEAKQGVLSVCGKADGQLSPLHQTFAERTEIEKRCSLIVNSLCRNG